MKSVLFPSTLLALAALAASCSSTPSAPPQPADEQAMMQKWTDYMTPGPAHQLLNERVGTWSLKVKMHTPGADEPQVTNATSECRWILDGHFIQDTTLGTFGEMPFSGIGTTGFDNIKQKYVSTWIDNMSTGVLFSEGTFDAASNSFAYTCSSPDPLAWKYVPTHALEKRLDKDHWVMQSFRPGPDGKDFMDMEIEYTRL